MLGIYAKTFMTATRNRAEARPRRDWMPEGHWWLEERLARPFYRRASAQHDD